MDREGMIVTWSLGAERTFLFTEQEVLGEPAAMIFTAEDRALGEYEREMTIAAREGRAGDDRWHVRKDGSRFWASGVLTSMRDASGTVDGFVKVVRDKTDERRLMESLRISEEQFARLFLANPAAIALEHRDTGAIVMANESFLKLVGLWRADVMGRSGDSLRLWADPAQRRAALDTLDKGVSGETTRLDLRTKKGDVLACACALSLTQSDGKDCVLMTFIPIE